jgi:hypothetical protein
MCPPLLLTADELEVGVLGLEVWDSTEKEFKAEFINSEGVVKERRELLFISVLFYAVIIVYY